MPLTLTQGTEADIGEKVARPLFRGLKLQCFMCVWSLQLQLHFNAQVNFEIQMHFVKLACNTFESFGKTKTSNISRGDKNTSKKATTPKHNLRLSPQDDLPVSPSYERPMNLRSKVPHA